MLALRMTSSTVWSSVFIVQLCPNFIKGVSIRKLSINNLVNCHHQKKPKRTMKLENYEHLWKSVHVLVIEV